ncbi:MAG: hypothetical protein K6T86_18120 [Pirellulales bacterium]|nr:hypothetical protein [Pirellulales bacterium]
MLAQQISKVMPWLVGVSLLSAIGGVVLAQTYTNQACFWAPPGGANRQPPCIQYTSCRWGSEIGGTCRVDDDREFVILSGNMFVELDYPYCRSFPTTKCRITGTIPCQKYKAYIDAQCEYHVPGCYGYIFVPGCQTHF